MYLNEYDTPRQARERIRDWFTFYNARRPHQSLDYQTPWEILSEGEKGEKTRLCSPFLLKFPLIDSQSLTQCGVRMKLNKRVSTMKIDPFFESCNIKGEQSQKQNLSGTTGPKIESDSETFLFPEIYVLRKGLKTVLTN